MDQVNRARRLRQVQLLAASHPEASTARMAAAVVALAQAKIAKARAERIPKVRVVAQTPARRKTAVAGRPSHRRQASSLHPRKLDLGVAVGVEEVLKGMVRTEVATGETVTREGTAQMEAQEETGQTEMGLDQDPAWAAREILS